VGDSETGLASDTSIGQAKATRPNDLCSRLEFAGRGRDDPCARHVGLSGLWPRIVTAPLRQIGRTLQREHYRPRLIDAENAASRQPTR